MNRKQFLLVAGISTYLIFFNLPTFAAQVSPTPQTTIDHSGTSDGVVHTVLSAGSSVTGYRVDCFLQNNGTHTMYYSFTGVATTSSKQLGAGGAIVCNNGVTVDSQALSLLGTNGDIYSLTEAFVVGQ